MSTDNRHKIAGELINDLATKFSSKLFLQFSAISVYSHSNGLNGSSLLSKADPIEPWNEMLTVNLVWTLKWTVAETGTWSFHIPLLSIIFKMALTKQMHSKMIPLMVEPQIASLNSSIFLSWSSITYGTTVSQTHLVKSVLTRTYLLLPVKKIIKIIILTIS